VNSLKQLGVAEEKPSRFEMSTEHFGRNDMDDRYLLEAARLAFDLALPTEESGEKFLAIPEREILWLRHLYERAVGGFYNVVLSPRGWHVSLGRPLNWLVEQKTVGIDKFLPSMRTDVILEHFETERYIVVDTKFTSIIKPGWHRKETLSSGYLYQIYAYLRSQEENNRNPLATHASGLLLHPSVEETVDETVVIQGHKIRFATVDLAAPAKEIRQRLLEFVA
jgi:5-methylcytosine-specific restriction enzyme subunit McrC